MTVDRPISMIWFERLAYLSLALSVVNFMIIHNTMRQLLPDAPDGRRGAVIVFMIVTLVIYLPLIRLAARRASRIARWILTVLLGINLLSLASLPDMLNYGGPSVPIAIAQLPISAVLIWLLFRADSRRWFRKEQQVDPEIFR